MKKTRKMKRELKANYNAFVDFFKVVRHYFPDFLSCLSNISDPRNQSYITYSQEELILVSYCMHCKSMRNMNTTLNTNHFIKNCMILFDESIDEIPHGDTINNYLKDISIDQL